MPDPFRLFRALLPHDESFVERLSQHARYVPARPPRASTPATCQHARHVMDGAIAFRALLAGNGVDRWAAGIL